MSSLQQYFWIFVFWNIINWTLKMNMKKNCLIILFCCLFKSYDGYTLPSNVIVAIMEELSIINPTILHDNKTVYCSQQIKFIKELSKFGHSISYIVDDNKYSIIEFVKFNDLQWKYFCENCIIYAPLTLIVTQIQSESIFTCYRINRKR